MTAVLILSACTSRGAVPETPDFVEHVERPTTPAILEMTVDGVTAQAYVVDNCGILIVNVPGIGEFSQRLCDPPSTGLDSIGGITCAAVEDEQCTHEIPAFFLGTTLPEASAVCREINSSAGLSGEVVPAKNGWWLVADDTVGSWAYPLDESGRRLDDPTQTEIDDRVAQGCGLVP